jgi:hypothetical protein
MDCARPAFQIGKGSLNLLLVLLWIHGRDGGVKSSKKL